MSYKVIVSASCRGVGATFHRMIVLPFPPADGLRVEGLENVKSTSTLQEVKWNLEGYFTCTVGDISIYLLHQENGLHPDWLVAPLKAAGHFDKCFVERGLAPCKNTKS